MGVSQVTSGVHLQLHVCTPFPYLRNGWMHHAEIWCVVRDRLDIPLVNFDGVPTSARASPVSLSQKLLIMPVKPRHNSQAGLPR